MTSKVLVETSGAFEYMIPETGEYIRFEGGTVVTPSGFVNSKIASGQIKLIEKLLDIASDDEYLKYVADSGGNYELANASFLSKYGETSSTVQSIQAPTGRGRRKEQ